MSGKLLKSGRPLPDFRSSCFKEKMEIRVILYACEGSSFRPFQTFSPLHFGYQPLEGSLKSRRV
jgi:hypothetical protein